MTKDVKKEITSCFKVLGIDVEKDADLARGYFLISLANAYFGRTKPVRIDTSNDEFFNHLNRFYLLLSESGSFSEKERASAERLIELLQSENLFKDHRAFFDAFSPFIVEWESFSSLFAKDSGKAKMLAVLAILLSQDDDLRKPHDIYSKFDPICDIMFGQLTFTNEWLSTFDLTHEEFILCFNSVFSRPGLNLPVKINGNISYAISKYRTYFVPLERLLIDYYLIKTRSDFNDEVVNPWAYVHKGIRKIPVEAGVSVSETLFDLAAYPMRDERPSDVIRSLFYSKSVSDSDFECSFLLSEFCNKVKAGSKVLVVHPSPDMILKWNAYGTSIGAKTVCAVPNTIIAELYQSEFPDMEFVSFEQIKEQGFMDYVLMTPRNLPMDTIEPILDSFAVCSQNAELLGLFPNTLFDENVYDVRNKMLRNQFRVERMMLVASKVVASSPRKKVLMYLRKDAGSEADHIIPTWHLSGWADGTYYISKEHFSVPAGEFFEGGLTIKSMLSRAILRKKRGGDLEKTDTRGAAEQYPFSNEITIHYTIIANRKNRFAGKAYYCSNRIPENSSRKRGERLTEIIEAGLRAKTEAEVIQKLEWIPFDDRVYPHIVSDIRETYHEHPEVLSLKTIWFCLISQLQKSKKYDEKLCLSMFCGDKQELSVLIAGQAGAADYADALECLLAPEAKSVQLQYWIQLDLIFKCAIAAGYVRFNPVSEQLSEISSQATEEQREVRNALTKKTLSWEEEERMLAYIVEETSSAHKGRLLRRYEKDSIWLAGAIKMFTGLSTREVCALQWGDFVRIPGTGVYQLIITKHADDKGNLLQYGEIDDARKIRKVPLVPMLTMLLLRRYRYLEDTAGRENLKKEPIVLRSENRTGAPFARPRFVTEKCHVLLKQAKIPEQLLIMPDARGGKETDINRYYGDIFLSNFRYQANHTCALTRGELNYILGIEPPDTFSRHYCDYSSDLMQYAVANKLQRWCKEVPMLSRMWYREGRATSKDMIVVNPHPDENAALDLIIEAASERLTDVEIEMDCELGFACHVVRLERGKQP